MISRESLAARSSGLLENPPLRECNTCFKVKEQSEFNRNYDNLDGYDRKCKDCLRLSYVSYKKVTTRLERDTDLPSVNTKEVMKRWKNSLNLPCSDVWTVIEYIPDLCTLLDRYREREKMIAERLTKDGLNAPYYMLEDM